MLYDAIWRQKPQWPNTELETYIQYTWKVTALSSSDKLLIKLILTKTRRFLKSVYLHGICSCVAANKVHTNIRQMADIFRIQSDPHGVKTLLIGYGLLCVNALNILRPKQNGRHFADDTFNRIFVNENVRISIKFSLKFVPTGPINN